MFKDKNKNNRKRCKVCLILPIKTPKCRHWRRSGVFIVYFEHISLFSSVSFVYLEHVNVSWVLNIGRSILKAQISDDKGLFYIRITTWLNSNKHLKIQRPKNIKQVKRKWRHYFWWKTLKILYQKVMTFKTAQKLKPKMEAIIIRDHL